MSHQLLKKIEAFRKQKNIPILTLCKMMDVHNVTYHRWKKAGKITGAYKKIVENFLAKSDKSSVKTFSNISPPSNSSDIAIIGIACCYPGASNVRDLWENILSRRVQFRRMLDQRLPLSDYYNEDPKFPDKTYLTKAAFLENFQFDWGKLRIPKKTIESSDIAHWLALDIALKTFEDAGYKLNEIPLQNTGVILGNTLTGEQTRSQTLRLRWPFVQKALNATLGHLGKSIDERSQIASEMEKIFKSAFYPVTEDSLAGGLANTIAGRICNYLNLKGGGYIVDGACSSSLLAVATASDALKMGNMDLALAGGVDISLDPFELVGFAKAGALAKDQMRVYDQKANGFLPGEGCGFVLLKRLNDAIRDKNYVYAVIKGWGISSDGRGGIMEPSSSGQSFAIGRAYKDLNYKISDVNFVEGHGTGTTKGDRVELEGIATAIDKTIKKGSENLRNCGVTSFKSIVGHTKAAAGVGGLIKAVLAVNQRILPPTANCTQPNDVFKDKAKNLYPIIQGRQLAQDQKVRAGISSAGFGGINCHITVESKGEPKKELKPKIDERALFVSQQTTEVFVFTSRTIVHLKKIIQKFKDDLRNISIAEMADLAALLNKKVKNRLPIKASIVTDSPEHLYDALVLLENDITSSQIEAGKVYRIKAQDTASYILLSNDVKKNRIGFLYPGQGSQRINMARTLVERYSWARDLFHLSKLPLFDNVYLATDKFFTKEEQQEFDKKLSDTRITQPTVVLSSLIWTEFFSKLGIEPQITLGHSLGELTAFYKAGAFNKETLIKFAQFRGELMAADSRSSGSMVSLFCSENKAESMIEKVSGNIVIANINSPNQIVLSGGKKEIEKIKELAQKQNITAIQLNVSNAFHSSFMKSASEKIRKFNILPNQYKSNGIKVYSCVTADEIKGQVNLKEYFSKQAISPVNFVGVIESATKECDLMIELGPGKVLSDLVKAIDDKVVCLPIESFAGNDRDLNIALAEIFVRNIPIKWEELYKNRLIKIFVPASKKKFIENQCEHPLKIGDHTFKQEYLPVASVFKDETEQKEEIIPGGLPELKGKNYIENLLINLTHKMTGFDLESISLNLMLLNDLNLDSIKAAELIGEAARSLGIAGQVDPSQLSNNTLEEISNHLYALSIQNVEGHKKDTVNDILKRYQNKTWVRNFVLNLRPEDIKTRNVNQLKDLKNIVFLSGKNEKSLVDKIEDEFKAIKAKTQRIYFGEKKEKKEKTSRIDCLIMLLPKNSSNVPYKEFDKDSLRSIMDQLYQVTELANSNRLDKNSFVVFVQFGGGNFGENKELKDIASSSPKSLALTLFLERPYLKVRVIDFDERIDDDEISQSVIDELQTYEDFSAVGYDRRLIRKVVYYENSHPIDYIKRDILWSPKDVVLVTGGAKGITSQCALEFARSTKARIVLIGRSPIPKNLKDESNEIVKTLKQFENENFKCSYYSCDVSDEKDVFNTISKIEKNEGKITGVIHGAGLNSLRRLKQTNVQEVYQEVLPKVIGAVNICRVLKDHPPKLIVGITSIIGLTGMEGSGWYGFSNEILNLYLRQFKNQHSNTDVVTIAYSIWDEIGMGIKLDSIKRLSEKGIGAIPIKEGIKHFRQLIEGDPGVQQVIVAARIAGIATWKSAGLKENKFRFLEKIEYILPGIELIARANLNIENDPYLLDHDWKGSLLFPFVFGFEAMTQAVAYVLGIEKFDRIKARNINLQRPISVPKESETTIEIHAQVNEQDESNAKTQVVVEIYSQETAYNEPHFSAVFEIDPGIPSNLISNQVKNSLLNRTRNVINLDVKTDIYGPILFQGPLFQCIENIHELHYDEETKKGECVLTANYNKSAAIFLKNNKKFNDTFLIGDPFFIDSMLQSMQLIIPRDISLHRSFENIEINLFPEKNDFKYLSHSNIVKTDIDYYRGDVEVIQGRYYLSIKNCSLKVLETNLNNASANDLVNPAKRDQKIIENKFLEISKELGFIPPVIRCAYDERLKNASKELRHKIELPIIKSALEEFLQKEDKLVQTFKINWLKSGKPVIEGKDLEGIGVSISHTGSFLMVILGKGEQALDLEIIQQRSNNNWLSILGKEKYEFIKKISFLDKDRIASAIWSISEVAKKVFNKSFKLKYISSSLNHILFNIISCNIEKDVVSIFLEFPNNNYKILSFVFYRNNTKKSNNEIILSDLGYDKDIFKTDVFLNGPQGQVVYVQRYPITFKNVQGIGKRVYFSNYFSWIGDIREYSLYPIKEDLIKLLETGKWGMATNHVKLQIFGNLKTDDIVESRVWAQRILGNKNSVIDLMFEWFKILPDDQLERVAFSEQRISWIQITGHGEGRIESFPLSVKKFFDSMRPTKALEEKTNFFINPFNIALNGKVHDYGFNRPLLIDKEFTTSLEESNLVGNIYFANYGKWLGKVSDIYFHEILEKSYLNNSGNNEFFCSKCEIYHLKEGMPFDQIKVKMFLEKIYERGVGLYFEFFKNNSNQKIERLAYANQVLVWGTNKSGTFLSADMPYNLLKLWKELKENKN